MYLTFLTSLYYYSYGFTKTLLPVQTVLEPLNFNFKSLTSDTELLPNSNCDEEIIQGFTCYLLFDYKQIVVYCSFRSSLPSLQLDHDLERLHRHRTARILSPSLCNWKSTFLRPLTGWNLSFEDIKSSMLATGACDTTEDPWSRNYTVDVLIVVGMKERYL